MIKHIKDTTKGVIDNPKNYKYHCYYCGELKDSRIGYYNCCSPECLKIKREGYILMLIKDGKLVVGCHSSLLPPED